MNVQVGEPVLKTAGRGITLATNAGGGGGDGKGEGSV